MNPFRTVRRDFAWWQAKLTEIWRQLERWVRSEPVMVGFCIVFGAIFGLAINMLWGPRRFVASGGITVDAGTGTDLPGVLAGLAASSGFRLNSSAPSLSFQSWVLESPTFQDTALLSPVDPPLSSCRRSPCLVLDGLVPDSDDMVVRKRIGRILLKGTIDIGRDERSRILTVTFQHEDSALARAVVTQYFAILDRFNRRLTADAANAKVQFLAIQVPLINRRLEAIQDSLERFYRANRSFEGSPELRFREERLRTAYQEHSELLASVRDQLARNEIQARGGLPLVQVVGSVFVESKPRRPLRNVALVLGILVLGGLRFGWWRWRQRRTA